MSYMVLEHEDIKPELTKFSALYGPFATIKAAKDFIRSDALDTVTDWDTLEMVHVGSNPEWGSTYTIVDVVESVKPVPDITIKIRLQKGGTK